MVAKRNRAESEGKRQDEDWPHLLSFGTLLASVLGVLLLGAVLRTDQAQAKPNAHTVPVEVPEVAAAAERNPPDEAPDRLARRLRDDVERLALDGAGWTAQLGLFCDPTRVRVWIEQFGDESSFHVLPSTRGSETCFRICWGRYASAAEAKAAGDRPAALRELMPSALPKSIAEVVE